MVNTLDDALRTFEGAYEQLFQVIDHYPPTKQFQSGASGDWSPHQVLAVMCGWLQEAQRRYPRYALGTANIQYNPDGFNGVSIRVRKTHTWQQTCDELHQLVRQLADMTRALSPQAIERDTRYQEWLETLTTDCQTYTAQLVAFQTE